MRLTGQNLTIAAGAACIAVGIVMGCYRSWEQNASRAWPTATGHVEANALRFSYTEGTRGTVGRRYVFWPEVTYTYQVNGHLYRSKSVYPERAPVMHDENEAWAVLGRFEAGHTITVYVDPADPAHAALVPDIPSEEFLWLIGAGVLIIVMARTTMGPLRRLPARSGIPDEPTKP